MKCKYVSFIKHPLFCFFVFSICSINASAQLWLCGMILKMVSLFFDAN